MTDQDALHLRVYANRSELVDGAERSVFVEGPPSDEARERHRAVRGRLAAGYLDERIAEAKDGQVEPPDLAQAHRDLIDGVTSGVTQTQGRALVGIAVLQLCVKAITPAQSVRLHKAGHGEFSWVDGFPMRGLDSDYITPVLRRHGLLLLNNYGFMMTRGLAENYPYSPVYKAALRGPRRQWLSLIEELERGRVDPGDALHYLLIRLVQRSDDFRGLVENIQTAVASLVSVPHTLDDVLTLLISHFEASRNPPRLLEIAIHSLFQAIEDRGLIAGYLRPLAQMRSANLKAGNVGDVELLVAPDGNEITHAWDAKYRKPYLLDELIELGPKLAMHPEVVEAGFITDGDPTLNDEIRELVSDMALEHGAEIRILSLREFAATIAERYGVPPELFNEWIVAYAASLCLQRPERAPIDEPTFAWLETLAGVLT